MEKPIRFFIAGIWAACVVMMMSSIVTATKTYKIEKHIEKLVNIEQLKTTK